MSNNEKKKVGFSPQGEKMACSASLPQVVLFISKDKLLDYITILVKCKSKWKDKILIHIHKEKKNH